MAASEIVVHDSEGPRATEDGDERDNHVQTENPTTQVSIANADSLRHATEYEQVLEEIAGIVNNSDATLKRNHGNVMWKHLTVRTPQRDPLILGERRRVWGVYEPNIRRTLSCPFPETHARVLRSENYSTDLIT